MKLATMIRFVHLRRDGRNWIADLELEDGHTWMGYGRFSTRRDLKRELEAIVGQPMTLSSDGTAAWF